MVSNFKFKISNSQRGITLIEIIVVVFIISLFSSIAFLNLPKIQGSFALNSAAYELAQNIRTAENNALSGVLSGNVSYTKSTDNNGISITDIYYYDNDRKKNEINQTNITFAPPNPKITITDGNGNEINGSEVDIVLSLDADTTQTKTVSVNTSGLIQVR